jgi:hypothetical protein
VKYVRIVLAAIALLLVIAFPAWGQETTANPGAAPEETTASPDATTAPEATTAAPVRDSACQNPQEVITVGPTTENTRTPFETIGDVFRVSYDVAFQDPGPFDSANIDIENRFGLVDYAIADKDEKNSFVVTEGAGKYDLVVNVDPPNGATYTVTIEDCGAPANGNGGNGNGGNNGTAAGDQYGGGVNNPDKVIPDTTSKKPLPDTGGLPLLALAIGVSAFAGVGLSVVGASRRRDS